MIGLTQLLNKTAKAILVGEGAGPAIKKQRIPMMHPKKNLPIVERGIEPQSFIAKKTENKVPPVSHA